MISPNTVEVWLLRLREGALTQDQSALWRSWLSVEERAKADAFVAERHRQDYIAAHAALRFVIGNFLGIRPDEVSFAVGAKGEKPALARDLGAGTDLRFNLSHTSGAVLIGVTSGIELGIDIERHRPMEDLEAMARMVMSDVEFDRWKSLESAHREAAFYNLWTRKEAYLKAIGLGLYRSLQGVTVPVSASVLDHPHLVEDLSGDEVFRVWDLPAPVGYSASICCEGEDERPLSVSEIEISAIY
jgi:4'-phosphopantetheinyl transferase